MTGNQSAIRGPLSDVQLRVGRPAFTNKSLLQIEVVLVVSWTEFVLAMVEIHGELLGLVLDGFERYNL